MLIKPAFLFLLVWCIPALSQETRETSWSVSNILDAETFYIHVRHKESEQASVRFSFIYSSRPESKIGRVSVSNQKYVKMKKVNIDQGECYTADLFENFSYSTTPYLLCFHADKVILSNLDPDSPEIMPDYLVLKLNRLD